MGEVEAPNRLWDCGVIVIVMDLMKLTHPLQPTMHPGEEPPRIQPEKQSRLWWRLLMFADPRALLSNPRRTWPAPHKLLRQPGQQGKKKKMRIVQPSEPL